MVKLLKLSAAILYIALVPWNYNSEAFAEESGLNLAAQDQQLLEQATSLVQKNYVDEVSDSVLVEGAIKGIVSNLDPHSSYLTPREYKEINNIASGHFSGIGIELVPIGDNGLFKVISPYEDGPAFKAGIKAGDLIIAVDGIDTLEMGKHKVVESLRGDIGTKVEVKIQRSNGQQFDITIIRDHIKIIPVKAKMLANNIAYINISGFNNMTESILRKEYNRLLKKSGSNKLRGLILDLRWNPGGLLDQAVAVSNMFLNDRDIVSVRSRITDLNETYHSNKDGDITSGLPIVALINSGSASAAEVVAGALQDNKRALLVGTKSFGKASVQNVIPLENGGALKLTTALYYTPAGKSIQADGITPDIYAQEGVVVRAAKTKKIGERHLKGHIPSDKTSKVGGNNNNWNQNENKSNVDEQNQMMKANSEHNESATDLIDEDHGRENENIVNAREKIGDESADFQLLRAIDTIQSMIMYQELNK